MQKYIDKATHLVEALPYIREFHDKVIVIKYGGAAMTDPKYVESVMRDIALLHFCGMRVVVVHGGGPEISELCEKLKIPVQFSKGHRITDKETLEIVQMVLLGKINTKLVSELNQHGVKAVGISGQDAGFLQAKKAIFTSENKDEIDIGFVGNISVTESQLITTLLNAGFVPVVSPIARDADGQSYNVNADTVASSIAGALSAEKLVLLSDVNGLYADPKDPSTRIGSLDVATVEKYIETGLISGGMIPKMRACVHALEKGVKRVHILDGKIQHSLLLEIFTDQGIGTMVMEG